MRRRLLLLGCLLGYVTTAAGAMRRRLLLLAYITTAAGAGKRCPAPPQGGPAVCPAPSDAANNKNCAATSCPAPPPDRFKGKKKVKVGTFDPNDIPEPP